MMKLNVGERLMLLQVLPPEGNIVTLKIVRNLVDLVGISEEEHKEFEIKKEGPKENQRVSWNVKGNEEKEFEIGERATDVIIDSLKNLDSNKKLIPQMMTLWEKFIENKEEKK